MIDCYTILSRDSLSKCNEQTNTIKLIQLHNYAHGYNDNVNSFFPSLICLLWMSSAVVNWATWELLLLNSTRLKMSWKYEQKQIGCPHSSREDTQYAPVFYSTKVNMSKDPFSGEVGIYNHIDFHLNICGACCLQYEYI